jgi:hypothetical protein
LAKSARLFHAKDETAFADLEINGHRETWPVKSKSFRRWLTRTYFERTAGAPNSEALQTAIGLVEAKAQFDSSQSNVSLRVASFKGRLYVDLCDDTWRAIEIDSTGWRVVDCPPVRFRRASGMLPLPAPEPCGSIQELRPFLNVKEESDFVLMVAWLLAGFRDRGPYPALVTAGEQGSAKSTLSAVLKSIVDPNAAPLRALPREDRDLFIAANNAHVLAFDNVSGLPTWISDTLCRLATGGGFAVRQLYTDSDEILFDAMKPAILNGIEDVVTRPDLADRAIFLTLEAIPEERRRPERELWVALDKARPRILGALLDAVSCGLKNIDRVKLARLPRMADFALWAAACDTAFWPHGTFMAAYERNRVDAVESVIDADSVASAIRTLMQGRAEWMGNASTLLHALSNAVDEKTARSKSWPGTPRALSGRLRRAATFLRKAGIEVVLTRTGGTRCIELRRAESIGQFASQPSLPSSKTGKSHDLDGLSCDGRNANGDGRRANHDGTVRTDTNFASPNSPLKPKEKVVLGDANDGNDAKIPVHSGGTGSGWEGFV